MTILLTADDPPAAEYMPPTTCPECLIICEHAGLAMPRALGRLGLDPHLDLAEQHIAWDIGAKAVASGLAQTLGAGFIWQNYSRLLIDCNRVPHSPQSIRQDSDHIPIPGNHDLTMAEKTARVDEIFKPYDNLCRREMARDNIKLTISMHSFTPQMDGEERSWNMSFLYREGAQYARQMAAIISSSEPDLHIGFNVPYQVNEDTDWFVMQHAEPKGIAHLLIELRNDQLRQPADIDIWVSRLAKATLTMLDQIR
jgi:predicted N-formylglutamate amidohydrolase